MDGQTKRVRATDSELECGWHSFRPYQQIAPNFELGFDQQCDVHAAKLQLSSKEFLSVDVRTNGCSWVTFEMPLNAERVLRSRSAAVTLRAAATPSLNVNTTLRNEFHDQTKGGCTVKLPQRRIGLTPSSHIFLFRIPNGLQETKPAVAKVLFFLPPENLILSFSEFSLSPRLY